MKTLIITEKPKVSQRIAHALSGSASKKRYGRVPYFYLKENGNETFIASAAGHLYSLKQDKEGFNYPEFEISWQPLYETMKTKYFTKGYINALISHDLRRAYENLDEIDRGLVNAGEARHIMDWYWGINISRALMHAARITGGKFSISAGRVQTPALSILVKREKEIASFVPEKFFELFAHLQVDPDKVKAKHSKGRFSDRTDAEKALEESKVEFAIVKEVSKKDLKRFPPVPFDLGELQSEAFRVFRFNPKRTQTIAQSLYESGLISYPRTSSQKYPPAIGFRRILEAISKIKGFEITSRLLGLKKLYPRAGKKEDPAHPAIYPTGVQPKSLTGEEEKLFRLIVHRFLAVFGETALLQSTRVDVALGYQPYFFEALQILSKGWMEFYPYVKIDEKSLPKIVADDKLSIVKVEMKEGETKPPPRYNPASLIRELEEKGLGTKATRAEIVDTLFRRRYIKEVPIKVTEAGIAVVEALERYVPEIIAEDLTRRFEDYVEKISVNETTNEAVLKEARTELIRIIEEFKKKEREIGEILTVAFTKTRRKQEVVGKCPNCGKDLRIMKSNKTGKSFVGCSNFPKCKTSFPLPQKSPITPTDKTCPECGMPLVSVRFGRKKVLSCIDINCTSKRKR
jgi:DNA topoisomerase-1